MDLDIGAGIPQPPQMSRNQALRVAALALPEEERADLALDLIDSLDGPADEGVEEAWVHEVDRRVTAWRSGRAEVIPFDAAVSAARERLKVRHG
jgi:putative addiction module component (TIGR02574 family)